MSTTFYPGDLTKAQWKLVEPLLLPPKPGGSILSLFWKSSIQFFISLQESVFEVRLESVPASPHHIFE